MAATIRYKPNNREFGELMMSSQTQDLADEAAGKGVLVAAALAAKAGLPASYINSLRATTGPPVTFGRNPRRTARVESDQPWIEFGSGSKGARGGPGKRGKGRSRPQGGWSPPYRILGQTGARIGKAPTGRGGA